MYFVLFKVGIPDRLHFTFHRTFDDFLRRHDEGKLG